MHPSAAATRYQNYFPAGERKNSQRASRSTASTKVVALALRRAATAPPGRKQRGCRGGGDKERQCAGRSQVEPGSETRSRMSACWDDARTSAGSDPTRQSAHACGSDGTPAPATATLAFIRFIVDPYSSPQLSDYIKTYDPYFQGYKASL